MLLCSPTTEVLIIKHARCNLFEHEAKTSYRNQIRVTKNYVGRDTSHGYELDGPGIECRSRWPRGLMSTSVAARLLRLRVESHRGAWVFVLRALDSKDER
jgi:hypothetical protein